MRRDQDTREMSEEAIARALIAAAPRDQRSWSRELVETVRELLLGNSSKAYNAH